MLYISALGCVAEKTVECGVLLEPKARNRTALDWQESWQWALVRASSSRFPVFRTNAFRMFAEPMYKLPRACLYWMKSSMAEASFIEGLPIRRWRPPEVNPSVLLPSALSSAAFAHVSIPSNPIVVRQHLTPILTLNLGIDLG